MSDSKTDREANDEFRGAVLAELGRLHTKTDRLEGKVDRFGVNLDRVIDDQFRDREENARYRRKTKAHERELERLSEAGDGPDWKPNPADNTGTHDLAVLKKEHDEEREEKIQSRRAWRNAAIGFAFALVLATITGCVSVIYTLARPTPTVQPK